MEKKKKNGMSKGAKAAAIGAGVLGLLGGYSMIQSKKAKDAIGEAFMPGISGKKMMKKGGKINSSYKNGGVIQLD